MFSATTTTKALVLLLGLFCACSFSADAAVLLRQQASAHKRADTQTFLRIIERKQNHTLATGEHHESDLMCGITEKVGAHTDKYEDCPASCPYFAQNRKDTDHCTFLCVPGPECGRWNPNKPIPDMIKKSKTCRGPKVAFCSEAMLDGTDTCQRCQSGFALHDGQCFFEYWNTIITVSVILVLLFTVATVWFIDLCCRENINDGVLQRTNNWRYRSRIYKERTAGEHRRLWPLSTNTCDPANDIAGPGMTLHFNFQRFFIIWPLFCALVWIALACVHNELFIIGTRKFGTPRHNCILVAWGYETQQRLMWTKVLFLAIVYLASFVSFLLFSIGQLRMYQWMDADQKTMKDFCLELSGLPPVPGSVHDLEKQIKAAVEKATKSKVIGVTVCWDYGEEQDKVEYALNKDLEQREAELPGSDSAVNYAMSIVDPTVTMNPRHAWMYKQEKLLLGPDEQPPLTDEDLVPLLNELKASPVCFVVFETEKDKNNAMQMEVRTPRLTPRMTRQISPGLAVPRSVPFTCEGFETKVLEFREVGNEPANVNWHNFTDQSPATMMCNFMRAFWTVYVPALLIWFFGFYVPYACAVYSFNYDNGAELPGYYSIIFTIVVTGGNATMYVVCDICCDIIGFRYKDTKQKCYMLLYLAACLINVFLDMTVTYYTALKIMIGLDFRTYHGERLSEIDTFTEQFETYAMQRTLGENTYAYAWPATFFLCFVLEPFVTIWIPHYIGKIVVRTHPEITGTCAEAYLAAFEFDLGRYADILLNVFLGILIFWFPGGYIWTLFLFMSFSHCFIYCFDHWRVLQVIPYVKIVICEVDWWAQAVMCFLCAMILGCLVFKANCESYTNYCLQDMALISRCFLAGACHFIVHFLLLLYWVPTMGKEYPDEKEDMTYEDVARNEARSWFSMNPVHCLRSKHLWQDEPPCILCTHGKEHLLQVNHDICCYFKDDAVEIEEGFDLMKSLSSWSIPAKSEPEKPEEPAA